LTIVVAFLAESVLIGILSAGNAEGQGSLSQSLLFGIAAFSGSLGLGLWLLMTRVAKRFVSFSRRRRD
jgi:hypothetical protein